MRNLIIFVIDVDNGKPIKVLLEKDIEQMIAELKQLSKDYAAEGDKSFKNEFYLDRSVGVDKALEIVCKYTKEQEDGTN